MKNTGIEVCKSNIIHKDIIEKVVKHMPKEDEAINLAEFFKVFSDPTRVKIIHALFQSEMCVCDISAVLDMTQSAISHQLRVLKSSKLVKYRKEGKSVYYSLDDYHISGIFEMAVNHIKHSKGK
ncbi:ArsR/SmtB family transcription factor [Helicovermis profundi]|uniref:Metalloregulator ArsR/SmtB family transcription factor n=1 Tax=Helicovermis profundi TaxID=3065157 RepID=A0AAU9E8A1_9FIRM|nr:metalloregulator ArsR/SmtB family transcription factor [Clostridia bacterium S502]